MKAGSKVSVILPTYNRAHLVTRALRSVFAQSRPPEEVLVVDDGSTDGTGEGIAREFPQVRYLWQPNRGVSAARNRGIREAAGEWIALLDSDDEWLPAKLARQMAALAANPGYRICHTDELWIRNGRRVNPRHKHAKAGGWIFRRCLPLCAISPSAALIHRSVVDAVGLFDESLPACEDYDFWLRVTSRYPVLFVPEPLVVKHGGHPDQLSRRIWGLDRFRIQALEKVLESGVLGPEDREAALRTLVEKIRIYAQGAAKRGRREEGARWEARRRRWLGAVSLAADEVPAGSGDEVPADSVQGRGVRP